MSENIYNIFSDLIEVPEIITRAWTDKYDVIYWNEEDNLLDLYERDGETFSVAVRNKVERDGYVFANVWDDCGGTQQIILQKDKRVEFTDELVESLYAEEEEQ